MTAGFFSQTRRSFIPDFGSCQGPVDRMWLCYANTRVLSVSAPFPFTILNLFVFYHLYILSYDFIDVVLFSNKLWIFSFDNSMKYLAAYLLLHQSGTQHPSASDIARVLESVGIEVDATSLTKLLDCLRDKDVDDVCSYVQNFRLEIPNSGHADLRLCKACHGWLEQVSGVPVSRWRSYRNCGGRRC